MMCGGGDGRARGRRARQWGRRGEEGDCLWACWVAECRQLEEELMGMVSARSGVTGESFSTLPLPAPQLSSLEFCSSSSHSSLCVFLSHVSSLSLLFLLFFSPSFCLFISTYKKTKKLEQPYFWGDGTVELLFCVCVCVCVCMCVCVCVCGVCVCVCVGGGAFTVCKKELVVIGNNTSWTCFIVYNKL